MSKSYKGYYVPFTLTFIAVPSISSGACVMARDPKEARYLVTCALFRSLPGLRRVEWQRVSQCKPGTQNVYIEPDTDLKRIDVALREVVMDSLFRGCALNPDLQDVYDQAVTDLSQYGRESDRYYCRRLDRYVSIEEVNIVAALEEVLTVLEEASDKVHALELLNKDLPDFIDRATYSRYIELVQGAGKNV